MVEIESNQNINTSSYISGSFMMLFYVLLVTYPYYSSCKKGKLNDNFMLSTAFEHTDRYGEILLIYSFVITGMWFLSYKGALFNNDQRLVIPIALWLFGFMMTSLIWIPPNSIQNKKDIEIIQTSKDILKKITNFFINPKGIKGYQRFDPHLTVAFFAMMSGQILLTILFLIYFEQYQENDAYKALVVFFSLGWIIVITLIILTSCKSCPDNVKAIFEIAHIVVVGMGMATFVAIPALPSVSVAQLPFNEKEIKEDIKKANDLKLS